MTASNAEIAKRIAEEAVIYRGLRRSDVVFQIRQKMLQKGIKNSDVAERLGVSEANVSRWLRGNQNIKIDTLYSLADAVEESLSIHLGGECSYEEGEASSWEDVLSTISANVYVLKEYSKKQSPRSLQAENLENGVRDECSEAVA